MKSSIWLCVGAQHFVKSFGWFFFQPLVFSSTHTLRLVSAERVSGPYAALQLFSAALPRTPFCEHWLLWSPCTLSSVSVTQRGGLGSLLILWPRDSQAGELGHPGVSSHCFLISQLHCLYCLRSSGLRTVVSCVLPVFLVVGDRRVNRVCYIYLDWKPKSLTHGNLEQFLRIIKTYE